MRNLCSTRRLFVCISTAIGITTASWLVFAAAGLRSDDPGAGIHAPPAPGRQVVSGEPAASGDSRIVRPSDGGFPDDTILLVENDIGYEADENGTGSADPAAGFLSTLEWNGDAVPGWGGGGGSGLVDNGPPPTLQYGGRLPMGTLGTGPGVRGVSGGGGRSAFSAGSPAPSLSSPNVPASGGGGGGFSGPSGSSLPGDTGGTPDSTPDNDPDPAGDVHVPEDQTHSPSDSSPGKETVQGDFDLDGRLVIQLGGTRAGVDYDQLIVEGTARLDGTIEVVLVDGFVPEPEDTFDIIVAELFEIGDGFSILFPLLPDGRYFSWMLVGLEDGQWAFRLVTRVVSEPVALAIFGFGLAGVGFLRRRRSRQASR